MVSIKKKNWLLSCAESDISRTLDYVNLHLPVVKEYQNAKEKKVNKLSWFFFKVILLTSTRIFPMLVHNLPIWVG